MKILVSTLCRFTRVVPLHRGAHSYLEDFADELELYKDSRKLMDVLLAWKPKAKLTAAERFIELCGVMADEGFWSEQKFCAAWIHDLKKMGYTFPSPVAAGLGVASPECSSAQLGLREWTGSRDAVLKNAGGKKSSSKDDREKN